MFFRQSFLLVLGVSPLQTVGYLCSQEYSRLKGLSGDHLVQAFSENRNFYQIVSDLLSFEFSQKLGGPLSYPFQHRSIPVGNIFFSDFFFLFPLLEPVHSALCSTASRSARSLFLFFIPCSCILKDICHV